MALLTKLSVVTPSFIKFEGPAEIVVMPGAAGDFAALANHAPMLSTLRVGVLRAMVVHDGAGTEAKATRRIEFAVDGGFAEVLPDKVIVLTDAALSSADIDLARARADLKRAEEALAQKRGSEDARERHDVAWAQARLDVTHKPAR